MDKLAQIAALCANPNFELAPSVPYRQVRAIWALWRIRQDLRIADRRVLMLRAALPFAVALLLFLSTTIAFNIGLFAVFTAIISSLVFLTLLYLVYWILAPAQIYEFQKRYIQEQSYKSAAD